jgi:hypothetical protein
VCEKEQLKEFKEFSICAVIASYIFNIFYFLLRARAKPLLSPFDALNYF